MDPFREDEKRILAGEILDKMPRKLRAAGVPALAQKIAEMQATLNINRPVEDAIEQLQGIRSPRTIQQSTLEGGPGVTGTPGSFMDPAFKTVPNPQFNARADKAIVDAIDTLRAEVIRLETNKTTGGGSINAHVEPD